jgi:hypothetical protein
VCSSCGALEPASRIEDAIAASALVDQLVRTRLAGICGSDLKQALLNGADPCFSDETDVLRTGDEVETGETSDLLPGYSGLSLELVPLAAQQARVAEMSKSQIEAAEIARGRLLEIRDQLARIGKAAGLPGSFFSLDTSNTTRLNVVMMKMDEVIENVNILKDRLPDRKRVDAMVVEARRLIDEQKDARRSAKLLRTDRGIEARKQARIERLLLDAMQHVSAQGLAAYPADPTREARYRLDHVYGKRRSAAGDPGAGGTTGVPDAAGPSGVAEPATGTARPGAPR